MKLYIFILFLLVPFSSRAEVIWRLEVENSAHQVSVDFTVSRMLNEVAWLLFEVAQPESNGDLFSGQMVPKIPIDVYLARFQRFSDSEDPDKLSPVEVASALIYLKTLIASSEIRITSYNAHRLIFNALHAAVKFFHDDHMDNAFYAKVGAISLPACNLMEIEFLKGLNWNLSISSEEIDLFLAKFALNWNGINADSLRSNDLNIHLQPLRQVSSTDDEYKPMDYLRSLDFFRTSLIRSPRTHQDLPRNLQLKIARPNKSRIELIKAFFRQKFGCSSCWQIHP